MGTLIRPYRVCFLLLTFFCIQVVNGKRLHPLFYNKPHTLTPDFGKHKIKTTLLGLTSFFNHSIKLGYEYSFNPNFGIETEAGYTFYSEEDATRTNGIYSSLSFNFRVDKDKKYYIKLAPFYQVLFMNDYLLYDNFNRGLGDYKEYRKTKYTKERFGLSFLGSKQFFITEHFFIEMNAGIGIIGFKTTVPAGVTQKTFRNGLFNEREFISPNILLNIKIGHAF